MKNAFSGFIKRQSPARIIAFGFAAVILIGSGILMVCLALFGFTTILGWCVYGERCAIYLPQADV